MFPELGDDHHRPQRDDSSNNNISNNSANYSNILEEMVNHTPGPIFLIVKRTDEEKDLMKVSPLLIQKVITSHCNGPIEQYKTLQFCQKQ